MNEIYHRISVRKYKDQPVEKEKILEVIRAGMQAPSAANQQPWEFYVVTDKTMLQSLAECSPYAGPVKKAPCAIVTAYRKNVIAPEYAQIDMSIAMENMWLETDSLGLGGVWLGIAPVEERMTAVEKVVGIPEAQRAFSIFVLGYPDEERKQQNRFEEERIHFVKG
ncbi:MAG: nitroreductase family protein [Bulleidia sp.]|nr:nitroreductase family protein [Bulleidia sp.]